MQFKDVIGQNSIKQRLIKSYSDNRMAHTQLFLGPEGSGTLPMALAFAQYVNCKNPSETDSCGVCPSCIKFQKNSHADIHFYFPNNTTNSVKKNPESVLLLNYWREYLKTCDNYAQSSEWFNFLGVGNKQGSINVRDAKNLIEKMSMKAYEAKYKIIIIWMAEKLNMDASNKLLKTLEEPPPNTLIILVAERYELIIPTVRSRAQLVKFNSIDIDSLISAMLKLKIEGDANLNIDDMARIANGNWNEALKLINETSLENEFFVPLRNWLRLCFAPKDYKALFSFNQEMSRLGREKQKSFLQYALTVIHFCVMVNVNNYQAVKLAGEEFDFVKKFSPFINEANQDKIYEIINEAIYHVERNAHGGILFTDLSFKLVNLMRQGRQKTQ
ncbi:MAG: DNA polymerase III subunit delta' [Marinilabiliales bacterium]|nr:MAG: DNA polymerase III subunit delta' [Marinilabiliales bacterium]